MTFLNSFWKKILAGLGIILSILILITIMDEIDFTGKAIGIFEDKKGQPDSSKLVFPIEAFDMKDNTPIQDNDFKETDPVEEVNEISPNEIEEDDATPSYRGSGSGSSGGGGSSDSPPAPQDQNEEDNNPSPPEPSVTKDPLNINAEPEVTSDLTPTETFDLTAEGCKGSFNDEGYETMPFEFEQDGDIHSYTFKEELEYTVYKVFVKCSTGSQGYFYFTIIPEEYSSPETGTGNGN